MSKKKTLTSEEINEFLAQSDSEESDWDDIQSADPNEFLSQNNQIDKPKKVFVKSTEPLVLPELQSQNNITKKVLSHKISSQKSFTLKSKDEYVAKPTKIRVKNAIIKEDDWCTRIKDRRVFHASQVTDDKLLNGLDETEWILVGVITHINTKKSKNDTVFCYWYLNDLEILDKSVKLFLFGSVYKEHWKLTEGSVVAILMPKLMDSKSKEFNEKAFTVENAQQIIVLGRSMDMGTCEARKKIGDPCKNIVNKKDCPVCHYHIQSSYFNSTKRPGFYDQGLEAFNINKRKSSYNYGGPRTKKPKDDGVKVNNSITMETLNNSGVTKLATNWGLIDNYDCEKLSKFTKSNPNSNSNSKIIDKSDKFVDLLKQPSAGSKNFIQSIVNKTQKTIATKTGCTNNRTITIEQLKKQFNEKYNCNNNNEQQRKIDLGFITENDKIVAKQKYRDELKKKKIEAIVASHGSVEAMQEVNKKKNIDRAMDLVNRKSNDKSENSSGIKKKTKFTPEMLALLKKGSCNKDLIEMDRQIEHEKMFDKMEKLDKMETKLQEMHEENCTVFYCQQCNSRFPVRPTICVAEGHTITSSEGKRRYYECVDCKQRCTTLEKYPIKNCTKCNGSSFKKVGKLKEKLAPIEKPLIDGGNKRWIQN